MSHLLTSANPIESRPLIEAAQLDLYRRNPFRITALAVDASAKAIGKHADRLKIMAELGRGQGANPAGFALDPPPSVDEIREAIQRLKDSEARFIDEFFWFWPESYGGEGEDLAIQAIARGNSLEAYDLWLQRENHPDNGFIASHNLAVMFHLIALDWTLYHLAMEVDQEREENIKGYWRESFLRWEKIAIDDRIWETAKARIRSLDDPRLSTGFVQRMRKSLPFALNKINAEAALRYAEQECFDWARIHITFVHETHQGVDNIEATLEMVLAPTRERVRQYLQTAKEEATTDPANAHEAARRLLTVCSLPLRIFDLFYDAEAHQKTELFDDVALTSVDCLKNKLKTVHESKERTQIRLEKINREAMPVLMTLAEQAGNNSERVADLSNALAFTLRNISIDAYNNERDFRTAAAAIQLASKLAKEPELANRIQEDCKTAKESLNCHYCGTQTAVAFSECQVAMYGEVQRSGGRIHYRHTKVAVPRCADCSAFHSAQYTLRGVICVCGLVIGGCIGAVLGPDAIIGGALLGGFIGVMIGFYVNSRRNLATGKKPYKYYREHPQVKALLAKGWMFGERPGRYG